MGYKHGPRQHEKSMDKHCVMDDDAVRECRRLYEKENYSYKQLAEKYNRPLDYIKNVCQYILRTTVR